MPGSTPTAARASARRCRSSSELGARDRGGVAAASRAVGADLLHRRAGRGLLESGALRRRALRPPQREPAAGSLEEMYKRTRQEGFGAEVKRRIMTGTYVLSAGYYDAYYLQAQKARQLIAEDFRKAFAQVDLIAGPTSPTAAFRLGREDRRPGADVPERHLHHRGEPGRPARHLRSLRLRRRTARRPAAHRPRLRRERGAQFRAPVPAGDRLAPQAPPDAGGAQSPKRSRRCPP